MSEEQTLPALTKIQTVAEKFQSNLPDIEQGSKVAIKALIALQQQTIEDDEQRESAVARLAKIREIYTKVNGLRVDITTDLDGFKDYLMSFERPIDDKGKDNEYAKAKARVTEYDQRKLDEKKKAELEAQKQKDIAIYKADIKAAVGRQLVDMLAGQKNTLISGMAAWEKGLTLENFDAKEAELNTAPNKDLKIEKYDACFHTNFNRRNFMNDEESKAYIQSLKTDFPYEDYNKSYAVIVTEIKNSYRARMGQIKVQLQEAKNNADLKAKRKAEIDAADEAARKIVDQEAMDANKQLESQKDMSVMEATFVEQGTMQGVSAGPSKKEASFENDNLWLKPMLEVILVVATSGKMKGIRNSKNDYIPAIQWWLTAFEGLGKEVSGVKLTDQAKTIIKKKASEE